MFERRFLTTAPGNPRREETREYVNEKTVRLGVVFDVSSSMCVNGLLGSSRLADSLLSECVFAPTAARALWGGVCLNLQGGEMLAPEALFRAETVTVERMAVNAGGFAGGCREMVLRDARFEGERLLTLCTECRAENVEILGDGALRSLTDSSIDFSTLTGDDLLWGARDVVVTDTVIDGDRFGYFSRNLTLRGCLITGRAPLRFAEDLVLDGCKIVDTAAQ